ncbi:MAG: transposase [Elusimicrobiaceae bacterium]
MVKRKWDTKQKAEIVLQGIKGRSVAELCAENEISQAQYYQWREKFLTNMGKAFEDSGKEEERLLRQNAKLKRVIGELTLELKKSDEDWL